MLTNQQLTWFLYFSPSPFFTAKDDINDSGIEASGELETDKSTHDSEDRNLSPDSLHPESLGSESGSDTASPHPQSVDKSHDVVEAVTDGVVVNGNRTGFEGDWRPKQNGVAESHLCQNGLNPALVISGGEEEEQEEEVEQCEVPQRWSFPPVLEDFDLMSTDVDPSQLEDIFADSRWVTLVRLNMN